MPKKSTKSKSSTQTVENRILIIRGQNVILDRDLAGLYGVTTKAFNQAVKRNEDRFPKDFMFQLTSEESKLLRSQFVTLEKGRGKYSKYLPYVFTEHGALMAANVLNSKKAVRMSVYVIRAFISLRETFNLNQILQGRLSEIERILLSHDEALRDIYEKIKPLLEPPFTDAIGFELVTARRGKIG